PWKFETGTPNIAGTIAFGEAIEYLERIGVDRVRKHEEELMKYVLEKMSSLSGISLYGPSDANIRGAVISFNVNGNLNVTSNYVAQILNEEGIAIRSGHHCCMPLMQTLKVPATARASFYIYN